MLMLPLPIVVAIVLLTLLAANREHLTGDSTGRAFTMVFCLYAASLTLIGIRWAWDIRAVMPIAALLSLVCAVVLYLAFVSLGREGPAFSLQRDARHLLPLVALIISSLVSAQLSEVLFIGLHLLYALLLTRLAFNWPESLRLVRLGRVIGCYQALWLAAVLSVVNALLEVAITISFAFYDGRYAGAMVGYANVPILFLLCISAMRAGSSRSRDHDSTSDFLATDKPETDHASAVLSEQEEKPQSTDTALSPGSDASAEQEEEISLMQTLQSLLVDQKLYEDSELNLAKLARKSGVPARKVSRAINSNTGLNVSQWVNAARIEAAEELLAQPDCTVNEAMLASGFLTRSNFYREFRRQHQCSPGEWRERYLRSDLSSCSRN
ncbi:hypothetical protein AB833_30985 [Chromatiales bacterium (ex Bugula neritina AB1)]|nr:hypothetical protein AB833_30985 [Chromatiales bacterium (ex Bugula neritina AB1)]